MALVLKWILICWLSLNNKKWGHWNKRCSFLSYKHIKLELRVLVAYSVALVMLNAGKWFKHAEK